MCGIAGEVSFGAFADMVRVDKMAKAIRHRGPDDSGSFLSPSRFCALAHRRLSIIDLSSKGRQPMSTGDASHTIVFNGEIYNYQELKNELILQGEIFHSQSDTEVLLALWKKEGIDCLSKLRGMFAFGVWDEKEKTLTLARDSLGIKPIYYRQGMDRLIFASEIKAFRHVGLASKIDAMGLGFFLRWGSIPSPITIYKDIKSLPAGSWLKFSRHGIETGTYWNHTQAILKAHSEGNDMQLSERDAVSFVKETLLNSVKAHLVSDVPVGAFLSGGIDSTAVVSLMRQAGQENISTFSITHDDPNLDESTYSNLAAKAYETDHHEWSIKPEDFFSLKNDFMNSLDQPTVDGFNTFIVSRLAHDNGFKVVTSGVGGDEFFAGYKGTFQDMPNLANYLSRVPASICKVSGKLLSSLVNSNVLSPRWSRTAHFLTGETNLRRAYNMKRGLFSPQEIRNLFRNREFGEEAARIVTEQQLPGDIGGLTTREKVTVLETSRYLGSQLLPDSDLFSMAHSLELRVPLVDRIVCEQLALLGNDQLFLNRNGVPKSLLVDSVGDLPPELVRRKKMGFGLPFEKWLRIKKWQPKSELLDNAGCRKIDQLFRKQKVHWSRRWALEVLDTFLMDTNSA